MKEARRAYVQTARAEAAAANGERILAAAVEEVLGTGSVPTLDAVAARAGVTVQTVLRRFGSKDGLRDAVVGHLRGRIVAERDAAPADDVEGAIDNLLDHYERWGDLSLKMLSVEAATGATGAGTASEGRAYHRAWVERALGPALGRTTGAAREQRLDALCAVTDVYVWKLLARDLGRPRKRVRATLLDMVRRLGGA